MRWFSTVQLITAWLIAIALESTTQSEILIIRHGRSRNRHSVEKDHVRWGLKALDNLTIVGHRDEFTMSVENETNSELNVVSFYESNGTLSQSNELNGTAGSFEINFTKGPMSDKKHWHRNAPATTDIPKALSGHRRSGGRKKEIMTNIKNTVNKGIQYLRSHENLDEIKIEINDFNTKRTAKGNKMRSLSTDQHQRKAHATRQIKINGKELGIVTIQGSEPNAIGSSPMKSSEKAITQRHASAKHIKNHPARNQIDMNINSNLADVFYVPTSTEENPFEADGELMQGDAPAGDDGKSLMENSNQHKPKTKRKKKIASSTVASVSKLKDERLRLHDKPTVSHDAVDYEANQQNDEINNDQENEDIIRTLGIQNDDVGSNDDNIVDFDGELDENANINVEDLDISDFDETSKFNRKNLKRGRDIVTQFLQIVESQHNMGGNCTAGTALNLGEGVVDRYAQDRFRVEAEVAVNRANMLTR